MAFLSGIIQYSGKLGRTVGRKNGNRSETSTMTRSGMNVVAVAPEAVANPRTARQAAQRMKMRAAVNFYNRLGYVLNHSNQAAGYRAPSRNAFMKEALGDQNTVIPFLDRGSNLFVPGSYLISKGSLVGAGVTAINGGSQIETSLYVETIGETVGSLSETIYNGNAGWRDGDKMTVVFATDPISEGGSYQLFSMQIVLNKLDNTTLDGFAAANKLSFSVRDNRLIITPDLPLSQSGSAINVEAAGIIQSRVPETVGQPWPRSNSRLFITSTILSDWMSAGRFNSALATYMDRAADINSDWYLNAGAFRSGSVSGGSSTEGSSVLFSIPELSLPTDEANPAVTLTNVAAIRVLDSVEILLQYETDGSYSRRYYNIASGKRVTAAQAIPNLARRLYTNGYGVLFSDSFAPLGITVVSSQGGSGDDDSEEDRP